MNAHTTAVVGARRYGFGIATSSDNPIVRFIAKYFFVILAITFAAGLQFASEGTAWAKPGQPSSPTAVTATADISGATISWTPGAFGGGGNFGASYTVTGAPGGSCTVNYSFSTSTQSCSITGLTAGTSYTFKVVETGNNGQSSNASAASNAVTPYAIPDVPTGVSGTSNANTQSVVSWTAPAANGAAITSYTVTSSPGSFTCTSATTSCTVTGLTNGTSYTFTVTATNSAGTSAASTASAAAIPAAAPGAPTAVTATSNANTQSVVSWTAPAANGAAITGYTVTSSPGSFTCTSATTSCTVTGLTNGTSYTFTVTATNAAGTSAASTPSAAITPITVPDAPIAISAVAGNGSATVWFGAPGSNGGSTITGYTVTANPGGFTCTATDPTDSCTITGLTNGTSYTFTVTATNSAGTSAASTPSAAITPITIPDAPIAASAVAGNGSATISFGAPGSNGGSAITGYTVTASDGTGSGLGGDGNTCTATDPTDSCTITGLTNGTSYTFTVTATNAAGTSAPSAPSAAVTPVTVAGAPTNVSATPGNGVATITWTAPSSNGGTAIVGYIVTASPDGATCSTTDTSCTISGLTNGTSYTFTVVAINAVGSSASSTASPAITPVTTPDAPTGVRGIAGNTSVLVSFSRPNNGGSAIIGFTVTAAPGGASCTTTGSNCTIIGLTNGTAYTFTVAAANAVGSGAPSLASAPVTPMTTAGAPTSVVAIASNASATISWSAPTSNGGSAITRYTVTASPQGITCTTTSTSCTISGLTNGTSYTFTVKAVNAKGSSAPSVASSNVTPMTAPSAPTSVVAAGGDGSATVFFNPPTSTGGSDVTGYTVKAIANASCLTTGATCTGSGLAPGAPVTYTGLTSQTSYTFTGLANGVSYTFVVIATNAVGDSTTSAISPAVVPAAVADAPFNVSTIAGNASVAVSWTTPEFNGGSAITGYTVTAGPDGASCHTTGHSCIVTGLVNGTNYSFSVVAINGVGTSDPSIPSSATPVTLPGAAASVSAAAGNGVATVSWLAPSFNGGTDITSYTVTASPGGATCVTSGTSCTVTGLTNGFSYTFTVKAANAVGSGASSVASSSVVPVTTPDAPTNVSALAGNASALITFKKPTFNGGSAITGYTVTASPEGESCSVTTFTSLGCTVTGLTNGVSYTFSVVATTAVGSSAPSASSTAVTPLTTPDAPNSVVAISDNGSATISWSAPASSGGTNITGYVVTASPKGATCATTALTCTISGLTNGTSYTFTVKATNAIGTSAASSPSAPVTPVTTPGAPTNVTAVAENASATVTFSFPSTNGGSPITGYTVTASPEGETCTTTTRSCVVTGLTNGTIYSFTVTATSAVGASDTSLSSSTVTPATTPDTPTNVVATAGNASAAVSWTAPTSNGGSDLTGYTVTASPGKATCTTTDTSCTVTGLTNGTSYTFVVKATNVIGSSVSVPSASITPVTTPDAPTSLKTTDGDSSVTVSWGTPASSGGSPVIGYVVTANPGGATCTTTATSCTVSGLSNGTDYTFTVVATNALGAGTVTDPTGTVTPTSAPTFTSSAVGATTPTSTSTMVVTTASSTPVTAKSGAWLTASGLPAGVTFTPGTGNKAMMGTLSATNLAAGVYTFTITATNGAGRFSQQTFTLTSLAYTTSLSAQTWTVGTPASMTVATNDANAVITSSTLPAGMTLTSSGGIATLTGTPTTAKASVTITLTAKDGKQVVKTSFTVSTYAAPPLTVSGATSHTHAQAFALNVKTTGLLAATVTTQGLPSGLSYSAATCKITGTVRTPGVYQFTVSATNSVGTTTKQVSITVN